MTSWLENFIARQWNRRHESSAKPRVRLRAQDIGAKIVDGDATHDRIGIPQTDRAEHMAILGRTGKGKSRLIRHFEMQDVEAGLGFVSVDLHGDATPFLLKVIARQERAFHRDLSDRLIVIDPADPDYSVGLNPLAETRTANRFVQIAEFSHILRERWHLDSFGARTDELLRNSLYVLAENGMTLVELGPLLVNDSFRDASLRVVRNADVKDYFTSRYGAASDAMKAVMREPILNKVSAFTADPHFRHVIGQASTFSVTEAIDSGAWILLDLPKGSLGEHAATLGSLFLATIKNALFARRKRDLYTLYLDEMQNLVAYETGLEVTLSEARKFGIGVVGANQFLEQYPPEMRAAILAVGTHIFFQLSSHDAQGIATALDGGKSLAERLKNLPRRHVIVKTGHERFQEALVAGSRGTRRGICRPAFPVALALCAPQDRHRSRHPSPPRGTTHESY